MGTTSRAPMTILCATDFSPCSLAATEVAAALARRFGDRLYLLHVVEPLILPPEATPGAQPWTQGMLDAAKASLARTADELTARGLSVEASVLMGTAGALVLDAARELAPRFMVVGTHGRKQAAHLFLGSVAERIARHAPCPVIVTREGQGHAWLQGGPLRLALAMDGTAASAGALTWVGELSRVIPCDVTAVRLYWPPQEAFHYGLDEAWLGSEGAPQLVRLLERDLAGALRPICGDEPPHLRLRAASRDAAEALAAEAVTLQPDAVVVGVPPGGRQRWSGLSIAAVLRTAPAPVICVPEGLAAPAKPIPEVRSLLVATDLSDGAREMVRTAYGHLRAAGGRVELLHVRVRDLPATPPLEADRRVALEEQLRTLVPPDASALGIATHVSVVESSTAAEAILQTAERLDVDLVAVGSHGRGGLRRAVLGSVADTVARHATRPVVIVRSR